MHTLRMPYREFCRTFLVLMLAGQGIAVADSWYCSCCGRTFPMDPRDRARYMSEWVPLHQSHCCGSSSVTSSSGGNNLQQRVASQMGNALSGVISSAIADAFSGPSAEQVEAQRHAELAEQQRLAELERQRLERERLARIATASRLRSFWDGNDQTTSQNLSDAFDVPLKLGPQTPFFGQGGPTRDNSDWLLDDTSVVDLRGTAAGGASSPYSTEPLAMIGAAGDSSAVFLGGAGIETRTVDMIALGSEKRARETADFNGKLSRWRDLPPTGDTKTSSGAAITGDLLVDHALNVILLKNSVLQSLSDAARANAYGACAEELYRLEHLSERRAGIFEVRQEASFLMHGALGGSAFDVDHEFTGYRDRPDPGGQDLSPVGPPSALDRVVSRARDSTFDSEFDAEIERLFAANVKNSSRYKAAPLTHEEELLYHYTDAPESSFGNGLRAGSSVTDRIYTDPYRASQELGIPLPDKYIPIRRKNQFIPVTDVGGTGRYTGYGSEYLNLKRVPPADILPARPIGNNN